ncbi:MAG: hypothetical protein E6G47_13025 [Actinobacteria bacterium]|nr:MAG: hypothetical protein E6G47_13025 [Actinomycetota bacterium]
MGREGIRRRKPKPSLAHVDWDPGIIEDLDDQTEWSSYGSGIPRLGNPGRQRIWWAAQPIMVDGNRSGRADMLVLVPALLFIVWLLHAL